MEDPMAEEWWEPRADAVRIDFNTTDLMIRSGISPDMSEAADERYFALVQDLVRDIGQNLDVRATGYRYGPAAGDADPAFIDFFRTGLTLIEAAGVTATVLEWLRRTGATEIRISNAAAEALATWEASRQDFRVREVISISRALGQEQPAWGGRRRRGDFVVVLRLEDGRMATVRLSSDGLLQELSVPRAKET